MERTVWQETPADCPTLAVVMINSREKSHTHYVNAARQSVKQQVKGPYGLIMYEVMNLEKKFTIGDCWNAAVSVAQEATFITFLGDDDLIAPNFISSMLSFYDWMAEQMPVVGATCYMMGCDQNQTPIPKAFLERVYTGMYTRNFLLENPFDASLKNQVDTEHMERSMKNGHLVPTCKYYFGYFYTFHKDQVSGHKRVVRATKKGKIQRVK